MKTLIITLVILASADISWARRPDRVRNRVQGARIGHGVATGQLTRAEAKDLRQEKREINKKRHEYKADGSYTKEEKQDIRQDRNDLSKDIYEEKHDDQVRPKAEPSTHP